MQFSIVTLPSGDQQLNNASAHGAYYAEAKPAEGVSQEEVKCALNTALMLIPEEKRSQLFNLLGEQASKRLFVFSPVKAGDPTDINWQALRQHLAVSEE
jgi:hypothetical protein